ncbi:MAG: lysozyme inhibitor LprI family protein [Burkholderiales bacterium]
MSIIGKEPIRCLFWEGYSTMRLLRPKTLAAFIVAIAARHGAVAEDTFEDVNRQCGAEYADPFALTKCLKAEEKDYGKELAEAYRKVVELQTPDNKKALIEAQRSWLTFQEKNCKFHRRVLSFDGAANGDAAAALCMLRTTMHRLAELEALLPNLER